MRPIFSCVSQSRSQTFVMKYSVTIAILIGLAVSTMAQTGGSSAVLQQKLAALKASTAANQQKLHQYRWTEIQVVTYKGEAKPAKNFSCQYGPDGKVQKTPMAESQPPQQQGRRGRVKEHVVEKKTDEMEQYMGQVKSLLAMYVPPSPQKMQQAFKAGNASLTPEPSSGLVDFVFKNYAQPGDQMTVAFDTASKKISSLNVNTYMGEAKDAVTLGVKFASLPDGTNYTEQTDLNVAAKQIQVTTTSTNFSKLGGM